MQWSPSLRSTGTGLVSSNVPEDAMWNGRARLPASREVRIHDDLEPPQRLKTLLHEWAHATMGQQPRQREQPPHRRGRGRIGHVLFCCDRVGVNSQQYTVPYVSGWAGSMNVVKATAERVLGATSKLIDRLENRLAIDLTPDLLSPRPSRTSHSDGRRSASPGRRSTPLPPDRAELLGRAAPERTAALLASAGFDAVETAATFRQLGVNRQTASIAMTAIQPYDTVDQPAEPLYDPSTVRGGYYRTRTAHRRRRQPRVTASD